MKGNALQLGMAGPEDVTAILGLGAVQAEAGQCLKPYIAWGGQGRQLQVGNNGTVSSYFALPKCEL